jgi:hypothetical protein
MKWTHSTHTTRCSELTVEFNWESRFLLNFFDRHYNLRSSQRTKHHKSNLHDRTFCESNDSLQHQIESQSIVRSHFNSDQSNSEQRDKHNFFEKSMKVDELKENQTEETSRASFDSFSIRRRDKSINCNHLILSKQNYRCSRFLSSLKKLSSRFKMKNALQSSRKLVKSVESDLTNELERTERNTRKSTTRSIKSFRESRFVILNKLSTKLSTFLRICDD